MFKKTNSEKNSVGQDRRAKETFYHFFSFVFCFPPFSSEMFLKGPGNNSMLNWKVPLTKEWKKEFCGKRVWSPSRGERGEGRERERSNLHFRLFFFWVRTIFVLLFCYTPIHFFPLFFSILSFFSLLLFLMISFLFLNPKRIQLDDKACLRKKERKKKKKR